MQKQKTGSLADFRAEVKSGSTYREVEDVTKYTLPNVEFGDTEIKGAGLLGTLKIPDIYNPNEMEFAITSRSIKDGLIDSLNPDGAEFRISESFSQTGGSDQYDSYLHVIKGFAKSLPGGDREKGSVSELETKYAVNYYKMSKNGKIAYELDIENGKLVINGVDYTEKLKATL